MTYQQIAEVMEMTPEAVKSLICRAHQNLRKRLTPFIEEGKRPE